MTNFNENRLYAEIESLKQQIKAMQETESAEVRGIKQRNAELAAQVEQLTSELTLSTDQNDMVLDEFVRVKLLTDNKEIHALCERAHLRMRQKVSVIDRNMMLEEKLISAKRDIQELCAQVELLQSFLMQVKHREPQITIPDFLMKTGQHLAEHDREVAARVVEKAADYAAGLISDKYGIATSGAMLEILDHKTDVVLCVAEYANKIKSGEVNI